jgi:aldehyde:ferredoxin oxidoreductase
MGFQDYADLIWTITGMKFTPEEIQRIGERIYTIERLFNIREGASRKDDYPCERFFVEPTPAGFPKNRNKKLDREKFELMIDENYEMHGWDKNGVPTKEALEKLGLNQEPSHRL